MLAIAIWVTCHRVGSTAETGRLYVGWVHAGVASNKVGRGPSINNASDRIAPGDLLKVVVEGSDSCGPPQQPVGVSGAGPAWRPVGGTWPTVGKAHESVHAAA